MEYNKKMDKNIIFFSLFVVLFFTYKNYVNTNMVFYKEKTNSNLNKLLFECDTTKNEFLVDQKWVIYEKKVNLYLSRDIFNGTPLNGKLLSNCAKKTFEEFGVLVPLELALSQAQIESGMGRYGRTPLTNPYNLGEYSDRTVLRYKNKEAGVMAYYRLIAKNYLNYGKKSVENLLKNNFMDKNGKRYANSDRYGLKIYKQYIFIKEYINNNTNK